METHGGLRSGRDPHSLGDLDGGALPAIERNRHRLVHGWEIWCTSVRARGDITRVAGQRGLRSGDAAQDGGPTARQSVPPPAASVREASPSPGSDLGRGSFRRCELAVPLPLALMGPVADPGIGENRQPRVSRSCRCAGAIVGHAQSPECSSLAVQLEQHVDGDPRDRPYMHRTGPSERARHGSTMPWPSTVGRSPIQRST